MIDRIKKTVEAYINTENRGNFTPEKFNTMLHNKVLEKYEELFFDVNRLINRQNRGLINGGLENITDKVRERIQHYITPYTPLTYSAPSFVLPDDLRYFDTILYNDVPIELMASNREFKIVETANPTEEYPIGLKQGSTLTVRPTSIVSDVTMSYLRHPNQAKWTYEIIDGVEIYNPSALDHADVDIHESEETDLILRVLEAFGVNLKEKDLQDYTQREEAILFNQENSN